MATEFPEETFLLIGQSLSRDPSIQDMNLLEEKKQHSELFLTGILQSANNEKDGTNVLPAVNSNKCGTDNQMMNSAVLVHVEIDDDKDSCTYSTTTPGGEDQEETESVATTPGGSDDDELIDMNLQIPLLEPFDLKNTGKNNLISSILHSPGLISFPSRYDFLERIKQQRKERGIPSVPTTEEEEDDKNDDVVPPLMEVRDSKNTEKKNEDLISFPLYSCLSVEDNDDLLPDLIENCFELSSSNTNSLEPIVPFLLAGQGLLGSPTTQTNNVR